MPRPTHPYIPMAYGFVYLAAVMDWASRRVLAWRVSVTLDTAFCIAAVEEAIGRYGRPTICNTYQGAQLTSADFTGLLRDHGIAISMDGNGCWRDNIFVERLWRSLKYAEIYLHGYDSVSAAAAGIGRYLTLYNIRRPTRVSPTRPPTRHTSIRCRSLRPPDPPRCHLSKLVELYRKAEPLLSMRRCFRSGA